MEFYMVEKFKGLLKDGRWPVSPQGILIPFDDSDSFDSAAEEDDEEYLNDINCSHPYPLHNSNSHDQGYSQDHFKKIIMKKMQEREKYERESVRNADKLLAEEEQERLRVKRQKEMKQRNKERKKAEKETNQNGTSAGNEVHHKNEGVPHNNGGLNNKQDESSCHDDDSSNEDENENDGFLDVNSAFVTKALKYKLKNSLTINGRVKATSTTSPGKGQKSSPTRQTCGTRIVQIPDKNIALGERLAVAGYQFACKESYEQAIELFTRALRNVPNDHRYWGNRSFCYFQTGLYQKALEDADCAIQLAPNNPKGHYRRAEALAALKDLVSAELSFGKALELDPDSEDASDELMNIRLLRMIEMGFERKQASSALKRYISLEAAVEALMNNENFDAVSEDIGDIVYQSSDDIDWDSIVDHENSIDNHPSNSPDQTFANSQNLLLENTSCNLSNENNFDSTTNKLTKKQASMDPSNPNRCVSIWVGNINSCVSEKMLTDEFSRFGEISSIRLLPSSHCAFINYIDSKAPGPAMAAMQGKELAGETLTIRYPNKTKEEQHFHQQILCHQKRWQSTQSENEPDSAGASGSTGATVPSNLPATKTTLVPTTKGTRVKLRGPVNGDECYYWRTTGCAFPDNCRNKHIKENQGVDRKPWHK